MANPYKNTGKAGSNSPANIINPKKAAYKLAKGFFNTAKQYYRAITKPKAINQQTPRSNFKPFHRDGKTYDKKMINEAFEARFKKNPADIPKVEKRTMHKNIMGTKFIGKDVTPPNTNFGRPDAVVKMKEVMKKSKQYPKSDPFRGSPDLR